MKRVIIIAAGALTLSAGSVLSLTAIAPFAAKPAAAQSTAVQTASFAVENMTCALCPVTVKSAMAGVDGVKSVEIDFEAKTATVVFDASITTSEAIAAASTNAGYPATAGS